MIDVSTKELVALHLWSHRDEAADDVAPYEWSTLGIGEVLDLDQTLSDRVELLATLASMKEEGLLIEDHASVEGLRDERNVYRLTADGLTLARQVHDRIAGISLAVVTNGDTTSVRLNDLAEVLPDVPVPTALARATRDGVLHPREDTVTSGGIVGRDPELETLQNCLDATVNGKSRTVFVSGESGIGKTTLVEHLIERVRDREIQVMRGTGTQDATEPYRPIRSALTDHRDAAPDRLFETETGESADIDTLDDLSQHRKLLFGDIADLLSEVAADRPVVLFLDDLHVADLGTIALFEHLVTTELDRVLLIGTYRSEVVDTDHPLGGVIDGYGDDVVRLHLEPLDELATKSLVEQSLDTEEVPKEFVERIYEHTGGHPLFVEATVRHLHEEGIVDPRAGHYPADPDLPLSPEVRTAIDRRLAPLDDVTKDVIDAASVIGSTVDLRVLSAVTDLSAADLRKYADMLVEARIWTWRVGETGEQLAFRTSVVRDAVRNDLSPDRQRALHEEVASALETVYSEELNASAGTIASHYAQADDPDKAIDYYRRAGVHATNVYAHETAIDTFERALELAREHDSEAAAFELVERIGRVHFSAGEYDMAERYFSYLLERTTDPETHRDIAAKQSMIHNDRGEYNEAIEVVDDALDTWDGSTPSEAVCELLGMKGWALSEQTGEHATAQGLLEESLDMAECLADDEQRARARHHLASIERQNGNMDRALALVNEAIAINEDRGDKHRLAANLTNLGNINLTIGNRAAARDAYHRSLVLAREIGNRELELFPISNLVSCLHGLGNWAEALERCSQFLDLARELDNVRQIAVALKLRGSIRLDRGDLAAARTDLERALEYHSTLDYAHFLGTTHAELSGIEFLQGNLDKALEHAEAARDITADDSTFLAAACGRQGRAYCWLERVDEALEAHRTGLEAARESQNTAGIVNNRCGLALAHVAAGRSDRALTEALAARETAEESSNPMVAIDANLAVGRVRLVRDDYGAAEASLRTALEAARDRGTTIHECEALTELGRLHAAQTEIAAARDRLEAAVAIAQETNAHLLERRCEQALAGVQEGETV